MSLPPRWTRKSAAIVTGAVLLVLAGVLLDDLQLVVAGATLAGFLLLASVPRVPIVVRRKVSELRLLEGEEVEVSLRVANRGDRAVLVTVFDEAPKKAAIIAGSNRAVFLIPPRKSASLVYRLRFPLRGLHSLGPVRVRRRDAFGLYVLEESLDAPATVTVYPRLEAIPELGRGTATTISDSVPLGRLGLGYEFFCIRNYLSGDSFRKINWKATARHRSLMVNEDEAETSRRAIILLDSRASTDAGTPRENPLETGIRTATAVTDLLIRRRAAVGIAFWGGSGQVVLPSTGSRGREAVLDALVSAEAGGDIPLAATVARLDRLLTPGTAVVLISPLDDDPSLVPTIRKIARQRDLLVIGLDPVEHEARLLRATGPQVELARAEWETRTEEVRRVGVPLVLLATTAAGPKPGSGGPAGSVTVTPTVTPAAAATATAGGG